MGKKQRKKRLEKLASEKAARKKAARSSRMKQGSKSHQGSKPLAKFILTNIAGLLLSLGVIFTAYSMMPSYKWVWDTLLISNLDLASENRNLSIEEKHEIRQGFTFRYLNFVNNNTPDSAIILLPHDSLLRNSPSEVDLSDFLDREKVAYFTYPRKFIYNPPRGTDSQYSDRVTHVAIINYHGYENLPYSTPARQQFTILPINPAQP